MSVNNTDSPLSKIEAVDDGEISTFDLRDGTWVYEAQENGDLVRVCALREAKCADFLRGYASYLLTVTEIDNVLEIEGWMLESKFSPSAYDMEEVRKSIPAARQYKWTRLNQLAGNTMENVTITSSPTVDDTATNLHAATVAVEAIKEQVVRQRVSNIAACAVLSLPVWLTVAGVVGLHLKALDAFWLFLGSMSTLLTIGIPLKEAVEFRLFAGLHARMWTEVKYTVLAVFLLLGSLAMVFISQREAAFVVWMILVTVGVAAIALRSAILTVKISQPITAVEVER